MICWTAVKSWHLNRQPSYWVQLGAPTPPGQEAIRRQGWGWGVCMCICLAWLRCVHGGHTQKHQRWRHSAITHDNLSTCHALTSRHDCCDCSAGLCLVRVDVSICRPHYFGKLFYEKKWMCFINCMSHVGWYIGVLSELFFWPQETDF